MKTKIFLLFLFILLLTLGGCGLKEKNTTLTYSQWGTQTEISIIKNLIAEFEKENPEIKVELLHTPVNYFTKLHLYFAAKTEPDVIFINNINFPKYREYNLFEDLTPYFKKDIEGKTFFESAIEAFSKSGKVYAIPRDVSNIVIFYNKDIFKKYGVEYPTQNWTINDLKRKAKALTKDENNDGKTDVWGINTSPKMIFWLPFLTVENGGVISSNGEWMIFSDNSINALQEYFDNINVDKISPSDSQLSGKVHSQLFMNGELAMYVGGRWNVPKFVEIAQFDWDVINFPSAKSSFIPADSSGWAVSKNSKHKNEAIKFVRFLSSKSSIAKMTQTGLITPARKDIANSEIFLNNPKKINNKVFIYAVNNSKAQNISPKMKEIEDEINVLLEPAFHGTKTVKECLKNDNFLLDRSS